MFTSKGLFWDITCPYQETCKLPGCIFAHPNGRFGDAPVAVPESRDETLTNNNGDSQRKRRKLDSEDQTTGAASLSTQTQVEIALKAPPNPEISTKESSKSKPFISRPVSPPPLRKKSLNEGTPAGTSSKDGLSSSQTSAVRSSSTPKTTSKAPVSQQAKVEGLNPRKLKCMAPAQHDIRFKLVTALMEQFRRLNSELKKDGNDEEQKLVLTEQQLITKALDAEEHAAYTPNIYRNIVKNNILLYKRMTVAQWKEDREKEVKQSQEISAIFSGSSAPRAVETGLAPAEELKLLHRLHTPISGLSNHGYVTKVPSDEEIELAKKGIDAAKGWEVCDRCKNRFQVFPGRREEDGALVSGGACKYHFGKPYVPGPKMSKKYRCCNEELAESSGCTRAESHVFKISEVKRMAAVLNFEHTPQNLAKITDRPVCIDGEMGYTVYGLELLRLTATSWPSGEELFDVLVRPFGEVLDLNSRYSGVWPKDMADAIPYDSTISNDASSDPAIKRKLRIVDSPAVARALLFSHLSPLTPLVGHGLENDMNATRIIHPTIIDTALLFPHKAGLPYRYGLKYLMKTHLNRDVQVVVEGQIDGHDSKEDANAAGQLVRFALANEWEKMKKEGWTLEHGDFWAPKPEEYPPDAPKEPSGRKRSREEDI